MCSYLATGVVCYDLQGQQWLWQVHLDVSTTTSTHPSRATSSPSVADLDGDGEKEVVVATMAGYVYVLSAEGRVKKGFPFEVGASQSSHTAQHCCWRVCVRACVRVCVVVTSPVCGGGAQMDGSVDAQVILEDLAGTSDLELLATDDEGNVVVIDVNGSLAMHVVLSCVVANARSHCRGWARSAAWMQANRCGGRSYMKRLPLLLALEMWTGMERSVVHGCHCGHPSRRLTRSERAVHHSTVAHIVHSWTSL